MLSVPLFLSLIFIGAWGRVWRYFNFEILHAIGKGRWPYPDDPLPSLLMVTLSLSDLDFHFFSF